MKKGSKILTNTKPGKSGEKYIYELKQPQGNVFKVVVSLHGKRIKYANSSGVKVKVVGTYRTLDAAVEARDKYLNEFGEDVEISNR